MTVEMIQSREESEMSRISEILSPLLEQDGRFTFQDVASMVDAGTWHIWVARDGAAIEAAAVTCFAVYPLRTDLCVLFLAGSRMREWVGLAVERLREFAALNGSRKIMAGGRHGWTKVLGRLGFSQRFVSLESEVHHG